MEIIDAMGLLCPVPVIKAKKAIQQFPDEGGVVMVLVDNLIATENLDKMAKSKGYDCVVEKRAERDYAVTITVGEGKKEVAAPVVSTAPQSSGEGLVVAIGQNKMGHGSDDLGKILIKGFIFSLSQLEVPPKAVVFFNSGVQLAIEGANTLDDLKELEKKGTVIRVCGTCVDFFKCKEQVRVGEIANMYDLVEIMSGAQSVINI